MATRRSAKTAVAIQKSRTVAEVVDPRVAKTRASIAAAFAGLLMRRPYDRIRVSDITRKAAVGRATFYAHFANKDALLQAELVRVISLTLVDTDKESCLVECTRLFAHVQHARAIFRSLTGGPAHVVTERIVQDVLETRIAAAVAARVDAPALTPTFAPRFVASTLLTLIAWSLEQPSAPSPGQLQEIFRSLVGRALGEERSLWPAAAADRWSP
jgi:AcrR family transcriptional regulator